MIDLRQTPEYAKYIAGIGWKVEKIGNVYCYIKKIPIIGSVIKIQRSQEIDFTEINKLAKKYRAFQIVIEPRKASPQGKPPITSHGFKPSKHPFLPSKTIHIDLTKSEKQLLKEMHYKTRYNIKIAQKNKVDIKISNDIGNFAKFWNRQSLIKGRFIPQNKEITGLYKAFGKKANLLIAYQNKNLLGGILMLRTSQIAYYMYAASSDLGKKLFAPTLLAWEAIRLAKKKGSKVFDFEGIYDERFPLPAWRGFTRFKKSFGGSEVEYPGAFTKFRIPL
ncbi:hypothetical protein A3D00_00390 [Candidatus Woesebacteria bacterium RIFCSPHIGHO2_02_FULL_38_9]|uniref:BioF2-like acetyltransferase domain-containing protein n=1 Tax=Candidatus Woesebacteria bacterium RIFCSPHIGHO2_01_FULL_39_28 TaxID=1802496 RepID=A0A1F7YKH5_9BACT|nr:MAG: hypothetical protein A2627_04645 [Candidatus Woesebacteria bacterium RIFCSPHIGHO2_01_FULL_39_28]OGM33191.1 MAG: hypothetical protein A3D00_00390 [Candidatus Woesebacteria bacterium RIFCSPHIGHO2_02_FULL_38_9]OGM57079.1 MAG: hypothetical protein A3A50_05450 [Candidatus Woesebacteria bacterium RIFCSPLOWO2_01_FULL_38_20]